MGPIQGYRGNLCPSWLTLHSKGEAGYFDPLDTPGFMGGGNELMLLLLTLFAEGRLLIPRFLGSGQSRGGVFVVLVAGVAAVIACCWCCSFQSLCTSFYGGGDWWCCRCCCGLLLCCCCHWFFLCVVVVLVVVVLPPTLNALLGGRHHCWCNCPGKGRCQWRLLSFYHLLFIVPFPHHWKHCHMWFTLSCCWHVEAKEYAGGSCCRFTICYSSSWSSLNIECFAMQALRCWCIGLLYQWYHACWCFILPKNYSVATGNDLLFSGCGALFEFGAVGIFTTIIVWVGVMLSILSAEYCMPHFGGAFWTSWCGQTINLGVACAVKNVIVPKSMQVIHKHELIEACLLPIPYSYLLGCLHWCYDLPSFMPLALSSYMPLNPWATNCGAATYPVGNISGCAGCCLGIWCCRRFGFNKWRASPSNPSTPSIAQSVDRSSSFSLSAVCLLVIVVSIPPSRGLQFCPSAVAIGNSAIASSSGVWLGEWLFPSLTTTHAVDKYSRTECELQCDSQMETK